MKDITHPVIIGSAVSKNLTDTQKFIVNYMAYFGKIAQIVSSSEVVFKVERENGFVDLLRRVEEVKKEKGIKELPVDEYKELEDKIRYDPQRKPIGNTSFILNNLLSDACSGDKWNQLVEKARKEAEEIAGKIEISSKAIGWKKQDGI